MPTDFPCHLNFAEPELLSYDTPLWHTTLFHKQQKLSHFAPRLMRLGILTVGQLLEDDLLLLLLAPNRVPIYTLEPIYTQRLSLNVTQQAPTDVSAKRTALAVPEVSFWFN